MTQLNNKSVFVSVKYFVLVFNLPTLTLYSNFEGEATKLMKNLCSKMK